MNRRAWLVLISVTAAASIAATLLESRVVDGPREPEGLGSILNPDVCTQPTMIGWLPELREASGLAVSRRHEGILWSHNDSGPPILHAVGTNGITRSRVRVSGATVEDWEAIASTKCAAGSCLYIGDVGDNSESRRQITIYRVEEPGLEEQATARADAFHAVFPDGPQDAEGLVVTSAGDVFIITKGNEGPVAVYRLPRPLRSGTVTTLQQVATLRRGASKSQRVTDAALSDDGTHLLLRTHEAVFVYRMQEVTSGNPGEPMKVDVRPLKEPQGEGLALAQDGTWYLASESGGAARGGTLARLSCKLP